MPILSKFYWKEGTGYITCGICRVMSEKPKKPSEKCRKKRKKKDNLFLNAFFLLYPSHSLYHRFSLLPIFLPPSCSLSYTEAYSVHPCQTTSLHRYNGLLQ